MRKSVVLLSVATIVFALAGAASAQLASDQRIDFFIGGGTLLSSGVNNNTGLPAERGGLYVNLGGNAVFLRHDLGINIETAFRGTQGTYAANEVNYRPILTDFNLLFQPRLGKKAGLDLTAGIGAADTHLYPPGPSSPGYANYVSSDHFMEQLGAGVHYYIWNHVFVRPEIHYYHIQNNNTVVDYGFSSNNAVRVGASVGFTLGGKD